jgi:hypothetical protein
VATPSTSPQQSPDWNVSPRTQVDASIAIAAKQTDYFSVQPDSQGVSFSPTAVDAHQGSKSAGEEPANGLVTGDGATLGTSSVSSPSELGERDETPRWSTNNDSEFSSDTSRKASINSVSFRLPKDPSLPQGHARGTNARRLRNSSPDSIK